MLIAQVSDTHIKKENHLAYKKVNTQEALKRCIEHLNALSPKPDIVIFSGDNVDFGDEEEYEQLKTILEKLTIPYHMLPGNHDCNSTLKKVFSHQQWSQNSQFLNFSLDGFPIQILGLDSSIPNTNYGELCDERLHWLEKELQSLGNKKALIFMHHPPIKVGIEHMDIQNLKKGAPLLGKLLKLYPNVLGIACGHVHRSTFTLWNNVVISTAPSPSHQVVLDFNQKASPAFILEPPAIHLHRYTKEYGLTTHISYIGNYQGPYPFYDENGELID